MSGHKEKSQIDPEADRGHHNLGFKGEDGDKIRIEDLDSKDNENIQDDDINKSNKDNDEGKKITINTGASIFRLKHNRFLFIIILLYLFH